MVSRDAESSERSAGGAMQRWIYFFGQGQADGGSNLKRRVNGCLGGIQSYHFGRFKHLFDLTKKMLRRSLTPAVRGRI